MSHRTVPLALCLVAALSACGGGGTETPAAAPSSASAQAADPDPATGSLGAEDQTSDGLSVVVESVELQAGGKGGWIALHKDMDGNPGPVTYFVAIPAGASSDVSIPTPEGIETGAYWPMLHVDDGVEGTYEFGKVDGADKPVLGEGKPVMEKITVTVA